MLAKIAKANLKGGDDAVFKALLDCGLALGVPRHDLQLDQAFNYPVFHPRALLEKVASEGYVHSVLGVPLAYADDVLPKFWQKFRVLHPHHDLFNEPNLDYSKLVPYYLHGDGGRTYKKEPILVCSMMPALGQGTQQNPLDLQPLPGRQPRKRPHAEASRRGFEAGINLLGRSLSNRFLFVAMKVEFYKNHLPRFQKLMSIWGEYLASLFEDGFSCNGETYRVAVLGLSGDQPFLREAGYHNRSFGNVQKSAKSKAFMKGVCWLCSAGRTGCPGFDNMDFLHAPWTHECGRRNPLPWSAPGPLLEHLRVDQDDVAAFYLPDFFHIWHMGVGKDFAASSMMYFVLKVFHGALPAALASLNAELQAYKAANKGERVHFRKNLNKDVLGYKSSKSFPSGHWSKGADTTFFVKFVEALCQKARDEIPGVSGDIMVTTMLRACRAIGNVFHVLFQASFWLTRAEAEQVIESGHQFCMAYTHLVRLSLARHLCLFKVKPKLHMLCHIFRTALQEYRADPDTVQNCLAYSTFQSEDFVGRISRLSRRVSSKVHGPKIYNRYVVALREALK